MMAEMAVAMPLVLAGEQGLFHIAKPGEVRFQAISREDNEKDWPFSIDDGLLACVWSSGQKIVMFFENRPKDLADGAPFKPRGVLVTTDPVQLTLGNMANRALFKPSANVEDRMRLVAPYAALGQRLCDQPAGARVGHGEL